MVTMEELLASQPQKLTTLYRGKEVEGKVVSISNKEITLDLGTKSEGVIQSRDIPATKLKDLKIGDKLKVFISMPENENGQAVLSLERSLDFARDRQDHLRGGKSRGGRSRNEPSRGGRSISWSKLLQAQHQKSKLQGKVLEINKGGLIVDVGSSRGFLPNSQVGFELLSKASKGMEDLIGQNLTVTIIEIDQNNNKLIFSQRGQVSKEVKEKLTGFKKDQKTKGKIVAILPFGLVVDVFGVEGLVFISDVSWERVEDLSKTYTTDQEVEVLVLGLDEELGRLNLSIKQLSEDPFEELAKEFSADEVIKGEVVALSSAGVVVKLTNELEGFLPSSKMSPDISYEIGKSMTLLVDSVDSQRRRINLAPFVTSTAGLIYK